MSQAVRGVYLCVQGHIITLIQRLYWAFSSMQLVNLIYFFLGSVCYFIQSMRVPGWNYKSRAQIASSSQKAFEIYCQGHRKVVFRESLIFFV